MAEDLFRVKIIVGTELTDKNPSYKDWMQKLGYYEGWKFDPNSIIYSYPNAVS